MYGVYFLEEMSHYHNAVKFYYSELWLIFYLIILRIFFFKSILQVILSIETIFSNRLIRVLLLNYYKIVVNYIMRCCNHNNFQYS